MYISIWGVIFDHFSEKLLCKEIDTLKSDFHDMKDTLASEQEKRKTLEEEKSQLEYENKELQAKGTYNNF